ncbi:hypothetical protein HHI36_014530 [Cryptolaemus montrouzieri]|uniref:Uncharacterized protein n=1 Tax=Cryptolaemus montrouzieri TaxID=559131 RepID=A0ABD2N2V1_9CUCU
MPSANCNSYGLASTILGGNLHQSIDKPTRFRSENRPSVLDLILVNDPDSLSAVECLPPPLKLSDHDLDSDRIHVPDKQYSASDDLTVRAIVDFLSPGRSQHIVATSRLGDAEKRSSRLLLVTFSNPIITRELLKNRKMLSTTANFRTFSISDDVSPQQAYILKKTRKELQLRQFNGETNLTIRYLKGIPIVVKTNDDSSKNLYRKSRNGQFITLT